MAIERAEEAPEMEQETVELPMSIVKGQSVNEGDVIRLKVISVGDDTITVAYATEPKSKGSDMMAKKFDEPENMNNQEPDY